MYVYIRSLTKVCFWHGCETPPKKNSSFWPLCLDIFYKRQGMDMDDHALTMVHMDFGT